MKLSSLGMGVAALCFSLAVSAQAVKITLWYYGEQEAPGVKEWVDKTCQEYEQMHPNVKAEGVLMGNEEILTSMQNAGAAQSGPDIGYGYAGSWTMDMIFRGWAAPLSDYWTKEELSHITQRDVVTWKDKVWCFNWWNGVHPVMYNKKHFRKAGLALPENYQWDWDELTNACEKLKKIGVVPLAFGAKWGQSPWFFGNFGIQYLDNTERIIGLVTGKSSFKDYNWLQYHQKVYDLYRGGYINKGAVSLEIQQAWQLFAAQKATMIWVNGPAVVKEYAKVIGGLENVGFLKNLAVYGTGKLADSPLIFPKHVFVTNWSPNKETAADFLRYMATPEKVNSFFLKAGVFPCSDQFDQGLIESGSVEAILASWVKEDTPIGAESYIPFAMVSGCLIDPIQALLSGSATPEEASQMAQNSAEKLQKEHPDIVEIYEEWGKAQR